MDVPKPLSQRWHHCSCGIEPVQCNLAPSPRECGRATPRCSAPRTATQGTPLPPALVRARGGRYSLRGGLGQGGQDTFSGVGSEPRVPSMSFPGKVRRRSAHSRGCCPEASVCPVPERVRPKVGAKRYQSCCSSPGEGKQKRGSAAQNHPYFSRGSLRGKIKNPLEATASAYNNSLL